MVVVGTRRLTAKVSDEEEEEEEEEVCVITVNRKSEGPILIALY
jgi:hypothetical protein